MSIELGCNRDRERALLFCLTICRSARRACGRACGAPVPARAGRDTTVARTSPANFVPDDVPLDVADDAAKIGLELAQAPVGAFELMGWA